MSIVKIKSREILDSRGCHTLEVDLITDIGLLRSSVPSVIRENPNAALELRDKAVNIVNDIIAPEMLKSKLDVCEQKQIDEFLIKLDGTKDKSKLGTVAISGVSMACCKAGAAKHGLPLYKYIADLAENGQICLPVPAFNIIAGGMVTNNNLTYQEFMILPTGAASFSEALEMGTDVYRELERKIVESEESKTPLSVSESGAFVPQTLEDSNEAVKLINECIKNLGYDGKIKIGLNIAASEFYKDGMYDLFYKTEDTDPDDYLDSEALKEHYSEILSEFPTIVSIEDPFHSDKWNDWSAMTSQVNIQIVSDNLTAMNSDRIQKAIEIKCANCLLLRIAQIGSVSEAIVCYKIARQANWGICISAGFGLTDDNFAADLSVGLSSGMFKAGSPGCGKYNQLLRIEEELGKKATYAGENFRNTLNG